MFIRTKDGKVYNLEKTFEIIYSKYKHDIDLKELEEEEE